MARVLGLLIALGACGDDLGLASDPAQPPARPEPVPEEPSVPIVPTYHRDVAPILAARCGACHVEHGVGPFVLDTYAAASELSSAIAAATGARAMPPWPADASGACGTFVDPRWLGEHEIATLAAWDAAGAPAGDPADATLMLARRGDSFAPAIELASSAAYQVRPGPDEYRCFVVDPGLATDRYITALAMRLDQSSGAPTIVHHMQLFAADSALGETSIDQREALDPEPGYACDSDGVGLGLRYIGVWAGGDPVRRWPDGTGIRIKAGHRLVVQLHYHNHGSQPVLDQTGVALELATEVEHAGKITGAQAVYFELAPGQADIAITAEAPVPLPVGGTGAIRGARIHMHGLGARARLELVRGGQPSCLLDIPRWNVGWQLFYRFAEPIPVEYNDLIRISCSYDTTTRSDIVGWGTGTDDEMCIGYTFLTD